MPKPAVNSKPNPACKCGSGKTYKTCHGSSVRIPENFSFLRVGQEDSKFKEICQLRYDVYSRERLLIETAGSDNGQTPDKWDQSSVHIAGVNTVGEVVGAFRLVADSPLGFPIEQHTQSLSPFFYSLDRARTVEVSHLVIAKEYRSARGFGPLHVRAASSLASQLQYPRLLLGLFRAIIVECIHQGQESLIVAMEESLWRLLKRFGLEFELMGKPIVYYGAVSPYVVGIDDLLRSLAKRPDILRYAVAGDLLDKRG
jgi:N-acyl amino acid synthase of PEP-CTERM/exosortase system